MLLFIYDESTLDDDPALRSLATGSKQEVDPYPLSARLGPDLDMDEL